MKLAKIGGLVALLALTGCAGSLGWNSATALPRGSYDEERTERVGPGRSYRDPCGSTRDYGSSYSIPAGYQLVPAPTSSPCQ